MLGGGWFELWMWGGGARTIERRLVIIRASRLPYTRTYLRQQRYHLTVFRDDDAEKTNGHIVMAKPNPTQKSISSKRTTTPNSGSFSYDKFLSIYCSHPKIPTTVACDDFGSIYSKIPKPQTQTTTIRILTIS
jgi:hypothetical protein